MKKLILAAVALAAMVCCKPAAELHPSWTYDSVVYEVNVRQYSPEGSNRQTLESAQQNAAGAIIGSKFVQLLEQTGNADAACDALLDALKH